MTMAFSSFKECRRGKPFNSHPVSISSPSKPVAVDGASIEREGENATDRQQTLYSDTLLDHFRNPRNYGSLPSPDTAYEEFNPLCGDRIRIELKISDNRVAPARSASLVRQALFPIKRRKKRLITAHIACRTSGAALSASLSASGA